MSYAVRRSLPPRPYGGIRPYGPRPYPRPPYGGGVGLGPAAGAGALGGALGAIGGTLGCLLCLAAIGALGLFACVIAITAYTKRFVNEFRRQRVTGGAEQMQICSILLLASLFYAIVCRMHRS